MVLPFAFHSLTRNIIYLCKLIANRGTIGGSDHNYFLSSSIVILLQGKVWVLFPKSRPQQFSFSLRAIIYYRSCQGQTRTFERFKVLCSDRYYFLLFVYELVR